MGLPYLGWYTIRNALRNAGFKRYVARRKPPISETTRVKYLAFAIEHLNWTIKDWKYILWSDETWATGSRYT
jgi:protein associated with RNAse G/E